MRRDAHDILLLSPPPWDVDNPPVNIALLASYLRQERFSPACLDLNIWLYNRVDDNLRHLWLFESSPFWKNENSFGEIWSSIEPLFDELLDHVLRFKTDVYGISVADSRERFCVKLVQGIKRRKPKARIILGGPGCSSPPQLQCFVDDCEGMVDAIVFGEGEETLVELVGRMREGRPIDDVAGVWVPNPEGPESLRLSSPRPPAPIRTMPFPTYQEFDLTQYRQNTLVMVWSRGCPAKCTFCDVPGIWGKFRFREADGIFDEIRYHFEKNRVRDFMIFDSVVNGAIRELETLCDKVIDAGLPISWQALVTPRKQMTRQVYFKMARAGCHRLEFGLESGSDPVLAGMRKMFNARIAAKNLRDAHDAGIKTVCFVMVGFPGETEQNFQETLAFLEANKDAIDEISTVNTAIILDKAELSVLADKEYAIDQGGDRGDYHWSMPGNNYHIRRDRALRMVEGIERIGIPLIKTNLLEGEDHCSINTGKTGSMTLEPEAQGEITIERKAQYFREKLGDVSSPDLLLVMCPPWGTSTPPLGVSYLASFIEGHGYQTDVIDFNIECYNAVPSDKKILWDPSYAPHWNHEGAFGSTLELLSREIDALVERIVRRSPGTLGFNVHCDNRMLVLEIIRRVKPLLPYTAIICGGMEMLNSSGRNLMQPRGAVDVFCVGEGERPLLELLNRMKADEPVGDVKGLCVYREGGYTPLVRAPLWTKLDEIPWPDFRHYDLSLYDSYMLPLLYCRGCIAQCAFCDDRVIMGSFRVRTAEHMLAEIEQHIARYGVREFVFNDLLINSNVHRLEEMCDLIIERGLEIRWMANAIIREQMTPDLLGKMRRAGCWSLMYGIESGSAKVLKLMKKMFTPEMGDAVLEATHAAGIEAWCNFVVGFPGEGEAELMETIDFINRNRRYITRVAVINKCNVLPETDLAKHPESYGIEFPEAAETDHYCWFTADGNTDSERALRVERVLELLAELSIPVGQTNFLAQGEADVVRAAESAGEEPDKRDGPGSFLRERPASALLVNSANPTGLALGGHPTPPKSEPPRVEPQMSNADEPTNRLAGTAEEPSNGSRTNGSGAPRPNPAHHVGGRKRHGSRHIALCAVPPWGVEDPPVGIGYLATYLRQRNWDISIFDLNAEWHHRAADEFKALWHVENKNLWKNDPAYDETLRLFSSEIDAAVENILASDAPYIGFSVVDPRERLSAEMARRIKKADPSRRLILGGAQCFTEEGRGYFYGPHGEGIDALVGGEGEISLHELLESWESGRFEPLPGIQLMKGGQPHGPFANRRWEGDVDSLGFPTYTEGFPFEKYVNKRLVMTWSRSCAGNCSFCKEKAIWGSFRSRTPGHVIEEIKHHLEVHGIGNYAIFDSAVNSHPGIIEKICQGIVDEGLGDQIRWQAMAIPRKAMTPDLLALMYEAGCRKLIYGVESGSDVVLKQMRKMFKAADAQQVLRDTHKAGIHATINILTGFPAEGEREFQETLDFLSRNAGYIDKIDSISDLQLVPGTIVTCYAETYGIDVPDLDGHYQWTSGEHNTHDLRKERIKRISQLCQDLNIPMLQSNTFDEGKEHLLSKRSDEIKLDNFRAHVNNLNTFKRKGKVRREVRFDKISKSLLIVSPFYNVREQPENLEGVVSTLHCYDLNPLVTHLNTRYYMRSKDPERKALWVDAAARDTNQPAYQAAREEILDEVCPTLFRHGNPRLILHTAPTTAPFVEGLLERMLDQVNNPDYILDLTGSVTPRLLELAAQRPPSEVIYRWGMAPLYGARPLVAGDEAGATAEAMRAASDGRKRSRLFLAGLIGRGAEPLEQLIDAVDTDATDGWETVLDFDDLRSVTPERLAAGGCQTVILHTTGFGDGYLERTEAGYREADVEAAIEQLTAAGVEVELVLELGHPAGKDEDFVSTLAVLRRLAGTVRRIRGLASYLIRPGSELDATEAETGLFYPRILKLHNWHDRFANNFMFRGKRLREAIIFLMGHDYDFPSRYIPGAGPFLRHRDKIFARLERATGGTRTTVAVHPTHVSS